MGQINENETGSIGDEVAVLKGAGLSPPGVSAGYHLQPSRSDAYYNYYAIIKDTPGDYEVQHSESFTLSGSDYWYYSLGGNYTHMHGSFTGSVTIIDVPDSPDQLPIPDPVVNAFGDAVDRVSDAYDNLSLAAKITEVNLDTKRLQAFLNIDKFDPGRANLLNSIVQNSTDGSLSLQYTPKQSAMADIVNNSSEFAKAVDKVSVGLAAISGAIAVYNDFSKNHDLVHAVGVGSANLLAALVSGEAGTIAAGATTYGLTVVAGGVFASTGVPLLLGIAAGVTATTLIKYGLDYEAGLLGLSSNNLSPSASMLAGQIMATAQGSVTAGITAGATAPTPSWTYDAATDTVTWLDSGNAAIYEQAKTALGIAATPVGMTLNGDTFDTIINDYLTGHDGDDLLSGLTGDDTLTGEGGADRMNGDAGIDILFGGDGNDTLSGGSEDDLLSGDAGDDRLDGGTGNDSIDGGAGVDIMIGGGGDDTYIVDSPSDVVTEQANEGADRIFASVSYSLGTGAQVETLSTSDNAGIAAINLTGNELTNIISGNAGANILDGRGGADTMAGLGGNDYYYVDSAGDRVMEGAGQGTGDRIFASVSYTLGAGVQVETLGTSNTAGTSAINLTGNELANTLFGNAGANSLDGKGGADTLDGVGGNDYYYVDNAADRIVEGANEGAADRIFAGVSYTLGVGVQVETLSTSNNAGTAAINLTGNELANTIFGNAGANILDGKAGADTLGGLGGNDFYYVDNAGDRIVEGASEGSADRVLAAVSYALGAGVQVETLSTSNNAGTATINLTGNELANSVFGNAGANILDGKAGADTLAGFGGADGFAFTTALGAGNVDRLLDFVSGSDKILLDDAVFKALGLGALSAGAFVTGSQAADANDRIIYNGATGQLFYDADGIGSGAAMLFATLDGRPTLAAGDFLVI